MGRVVSVEPIFAVSDAPRTVAHDEQLGFSTSHHDEGYAFAHRNELTIHLAGPSVAPERVGRAERQGIRMSLCSRAIRFSSSLSSDSLTGVTIDQWLPTGQR